MRRPIGVLLALILLVLVGACSQSTPPQPADDAAPPFGQDAVEGDL